MTKLLIFFVWRRKMTASFKSEIKKSIVICILVFVSVIHSETGYNDREPTQAILNFSGRQSSSKSHHSSLLSFSIDDWVESLYDCVLQRPTCVDHNTHSHTRNTGTRARAHDVRCTQIEVYVTRYSDNKKPWSIEETRAQRFICGANYACYVMYNSWWRGWSDSVNWVVRCA